MAPARATAATTGPTCSNAYLDGDARLGPAQPPPFGAFLAPVDTPYQMRALPP
ncbi:MAG TPA: hypothetical protein VHA57_09790 [Actinomycetota bacterium]|nr:hypothetical protein [Actinomycetota bacterium]